MLQKSHLGGTECSLDFLHQDRLSAWREQALALARHALAGTDASRPLVVAGLSEGAELLPAFAREFPEATLLVMIGNAGLDPFTTGSLQAKRLGLEQRWQAIFSAVDAGGTTPRLIEGRDWRYWHDLRQWPLQQALLDDPRPLLHVWGGQDELVPQEAYQLFQASAARRGGGYCALRFDTADHQLRDGGMDRLQAVWRGLEGHFRTPQTGWAAECAHLQRAGAAVSAR